ncbi:MAG: winged helix-turn-helix transcriptional regulator [Candidatus Heimdallarchaeota archaeon]|nr:winged helix-turn-helix transcriptional regulator [Candidatus Heimdallarchaeota archaeon]
MSEKELSEIKKLQQGIFDYLEGFSVILSSLGNKKRMYIMALLIDGPKLLTSIEKELKLGKTALAHHINLLLKANLIERVTRGEYKISEDGLEFLKENFSIYGASSFRSKEKTEQSQRRYNRVYKLRTEGKSATKEISIKAKFQKHNLTLVGAMTGALKALGCKITVDEVAGFTGYGFLINVPKDGLWSSSPTSHKGFKIILQAISKFGWKIKRYSEEEALPSDFSYSKPLSMRDEVRARNIFEMIKKEIDKDLPVVLWGVHVPEYGIVTGYKNDNYIVSSIHTLDERFRNQIPYNKLDAEGAVNVYMFEEKIDQKIESEEHKESIKRAIKFAGSRKLANDSFISGIEAYDTWIAHLDKGITEETKYFGNIYMINSYLDSRKSVVEYLGKLIKIYRGTPQITELYQTFYEYQKSVKIYNQLSTLFPRRGLETVTDEKCKRAINLLGLLKKHESEAIDCMKKAVEIWE